MRNLRGFVPKKTDVKYNQPQEPIEKVADLFNLF